MQNFKTIYENHLLPLLDNLRGDLLLGEMSKITDTQVLDWLENNVRNVDDWMFRFAREGETIREAVRRAIREET